MKHETEAATRCTERLALAAIAEEVSKAEVLQTMSITDINEKLKSLVAAQMVFPVNLAVELCNKHSAEKIFCRVPGGGRAHLHE